MNTHIHSAKDKIEAPLSTRSKSSGALLSAHASSQTIPRRPDTTHRPATQRPDTQRVKFIASRARAALPRSSHARGKPTRRGQPTARDRTGVRWGQQWGPARRARLHWGAGKARPQQRRKPRPPNLLTKPSARERMGPEPPNAADGSRARSNRMYRYGRRFECASQHHLQREEYARLEVQIVLRLEGLCDSEA